MMVTAAHKGELERGFESLFCHHAATLAMIYFKYSGGVLWWLPVPPIILTGVGYFYICTTCNQTSCSRIMIGMALQQEEPCHLKANEDRCVTGNTEFVAVAHLLTWDYYYYFFKGGHIIFETN